MPNSPASSTGSGMESHATFTKGMECLLLILCTALARVSLPVPLSPRMRTGMFTSASFLTVLKTSCIGWLRPMSSPGQAAPGCPPMLSTWSMYVWTALLTVSLTSSMATGFVKKSKAPMSIALNASSLSSSPVTTTALKRGFTERISLTVLMPSVASKGIGGNPRSIIPTGTCPEPAILTASDLVAASKTS